MPSKTDKVECIVFRKTNRAIEYLLLKRIPSKGGFWQPPTGGVEATDQSLLAAALRELHEETTIKQSDILNIFEQIHSFTFDSHYLTGEAITPIKEYVFAFEITKDTVISIDQNIYPEHEEVKWVTMDAALSLLKWENNKDALRKVHSLVMSLSVPSLL